MLNLHAIWPRSRANGPGIRTALWFQGCTLECPGCFNPATHSSEPRWMVDVDELAEQIVVDERALEGITISGGEPLQQPEALLRLLSAVRTRTKLSLLLFSGYTMAEIRRMPLGPPILDRVDVMIAGRYAQAHRLARGLRGSSNQTVHLLTGRYMRRKSKKPRCPRSGSTRRAMSRSAASNLHP
ncbi:MAG: radical SAM protein [Candidatus Tectomicrobia bacterium]|uniref:Anaerobic ribonucleoside-triphosphate reductase-activating protein n=1 Tax=Tectimicrobiota bacterium TaxID=2528274 RepID=A0A932CM20_UNCTE|nr:radical SAM protein [Candidatus Tectomicrobia bacterium]